MKFHAGNFSLNESLGLGLIAGRLNHYLRIINVKTLEQISKLSIRIICINLTILTIFIRDFKLIQKMY